MLRPGFFNDGFFGDLFDDCFNDFRREPKPAPGPKPFASMKTDIREDGNDFVLEMDLPGFKKENVSAELKDGYLIVSAKKTEEKEEAPEKGRYIRRERYTGNMRRSFYVGKKLMESDIKAEFADGVLKLRVPKEDAIDREEEKKLIEIL